MRSFLSDNADLEFYLDRGIDWETLASLCERGYRDPEGFQDAREAHAFYAQVASAVGEFAAREVAPFESELDRQEFRLEAGEVIVPPRLAAVFDKLAALGLHGLNLPRELGGMNAPMLLYFVNCELLARADVSVMAHHGFHGGTAMALFVMSLLEGSTELDGESGRVTRTRWPEEIAEIVAGKAWGSMDITEPDAGSDMAALRATGSEGPDGWRLSGEKIFVTSGHGKYHFVLARTEPPGDAAGLRGLSLFLVPAYRDEPDGSRTRLATIHRVEDKLGKHASATVALGFDRTPAQLVGKRGEGFRLMLEFMNHARLGVGFEAIGLCEAARRLSAAYAAERRSMGKPLDRHEMIADYLSEMETDIVGLRALAMHAAFEDELAYRLQFFGALDVSREEAVRRARVHAGRARRATPLLKYLAAEKAVEMARRCLQIHGGNGYMTAFGAEKLVRDALVLPIYEGTSQIQALMAMKDTLGAILRSPRAFVKRVAAARFRAISAREPLEVRVARLQQLCRTAEQHLIWRTLGAKLENLTQTPFPRWRDELFSQWDPKRDFSWALLHAERLTRLLADEAIVETLLAQARVHSERRVWLERYLERAEPRARFLLAEITTTGSRLLVDLKARQSASDA